MQSDPRAKRRMRELAQERADGFDATIAHNTVYDHVQGAHDRDSELERLLTLAEGAYGLASDLGSVSEDDVAMDIFGAAQSLDEHVETLVDEMIADALAGLLEDVDDYGDLYSAEGITDAKCEARDWLQGHSEAAERAGVWEEVTA